MPTVDSPNPYMCETTDYTAYAILIIKIVYTKWKRTVYIYSVQLTSLNKKGETRTKSSRTQSYSGTPRLHFDKTFSHSGTWKRVLFSLPKGAGHGHSLVTGAVFRSENQDLQY